MKNLFLYFISLGVFAQNPAQNVVSKIEKVSVFLNGAQINRSAKIGFPPGRTELIFRGLSPQLEKQSIQLKSEGKFTILSVVHQFNSQNEKAKQEEITVIEKQKQEIEDKIRVEKFELLVFKREEDMLLKNHVVGGTYAGTKISDLKEAVDYQRLRMQEVLRKQLEIEQKMRKLDDEIKVQNKRLTELTMAKEQTMSEIAVVVSSKEAIPNADFSLSYFVQNAGWMPTYDIRVENISQPIDLAYKANIYQYSGEDWKDVKLSLSTANPKKNGVAPVLFAWNWGFANNYSNYHQSIDNQPVSIGNEVRGFVKSFDDNLGLHGASVQIKGTNHGTQTDANGFFKITIPPNLKRETTTLVFSFVGYNTKEIFAKNTFENISLETDAKALQEVVVVGYGIQNKKAVTGSVSVIKSDDFLVGSIPGVSVRGNSSIYGSRSTQIPLEINEKESTTSQTFEIQMPYTIPSDGKVYTAEIKEESLPANYQHFCIPKIDTDVFLNAQVIDWEKYHLLEGEASLYFEGTYIGKTQLNLSNRDTLSLSLGRDKNVIVSRIKLKEFQKRQFIGSNKIDTRKYEIVVRNTKNEPINMVLEDQFPISNYKGVDVEDKIAPEADENQETGKLTWRFGLEPSKQKKINFGFLVKSPKSGFVEVD